MEKTVCPARLSGTLPVPGSKSHTIRALLIASQAEGTSVIKNPLFSSDTEACIEACRVFGATIFRVGQDLEVEGAGEKFATFARDGGTIDVGNSGTTLYLAAGLAACGTAPFTFTGDDQIKRRPIGPLLRALRDLGAEAVSINGNHCAPVRITGPLQGGETTIECPTSQYLSSLLLAAPLATNGLLSSAPRAHSTTGVPMSEISVPLLNEAPYVRMTLSWLDFQCIEYEAAADLSRFSVPGGQTYHPFTRTVPGDFSSATFFLCAAAVTGSTITLQDLDMGDCQGDKAVVEILESMGCAVRIDAHTMALTIEGKRLHGRDIDLNAIPDALPALAVTGCFAEGTTRLINVPQARLKETDRITVMREELSKMGANIEELEDGLVIRGSTLKALKGTQVSGRQDHRVVMALAVAGLAATGETTIDTAEAVAVTFPDFFSLLEQLKANV